MKTQTLLSGAAAPLISLQFGSEIAVDILRRLGAEIVFGYPGASVTPLFDCLLKRTAAASGFVPAPRQADYRH